MAYHTPPLQKAKKQGDMPLPFLSPLNSVKGMGLRMGNGIFPGFFAFLRGGVQQVNPKSQFYLGR